MEKPRSRKRAEIEKRAEIKTKDKKKRRPLW